MGAVVEKRMEPVPHRLQTACLFWRVSWHVLYLLGQLYAFLPCPCSSSSANRWESEVECARECP